MSSSSPSSSVSVPRCSSNPRAACSGNASQPISQRSSIPNGPGPPRRLPPFPCSGFTLRPQAGSGQQVAQAQNSGDSFEVSGFAATDPNAFMANVENYLKAKEFEPDGGAVPALIMKPRIVQPRQGEMIPAGLDYQSGLLMQR